MASEEVIRKPDCQYALEQIDVWKKHKEHERQCKLDEQKQVIFIPFANYHFIIT